MLAGLGEFFFLDVPVLAIAMLLLGFWMLLKSLLEKNANSLAWQDFCCCGLGNLKSNPSPTGGQPCDHWSAPR